MKKLALGSLCLLVVLALVSGCGGTSGVPASSAAPAGDVMVLKAAHVVSEESSTHQILARYGDEVSKISGGRITVDVYGNSVLGTAREIAESLQTGAIEIALLANAPYGGFTDALTCFDVPYLFDTLEEGEYVLDSPFGTEVLSDLADQGFYHIGWTAVTWRNMSTTRVEAHSPADMKGLKMRVIESPLHIEHFNLIGCSATPMAFSELYTALQQGVVDGQDNHWLEMWSSALHEVQGFIMETNHIMDPSSIMMSKVIYDGITPEQQNWIDQAFQDAKTELRDIMKNNEISDRQSVIDAGHCKVIEFTPEERASFKAAAQSMIDKYAASNPNVQKIIELTAEYRAKG